MLEHVTEPVADVITVFQDYMGMDAILTAQPDVQGHVLETLVNVTLVTQDGTGKYVALPVLMAVLEDVTKTQGDVTVVDQGCMGTSVINHVVTIANHVHSYTNGVLNVQTDTMDTML